MRPIAVASLLYDCNGSLSRNEQSNNFYTSSSCLADHLEPVVRLRRCWPEPESALIYSTEMVNKRNNHTKMHKIEGFLSFIITVNDILTNQVK